MKAKEGPAPLPPGHHCLLQELAASQRPTMHTKWKLIRAIGERVPLSAPVSHVNRDATLVMIKSGSPGEGPGRAPGEECPAGGAGGGR